MAGEEPVSDPAPLELRRRRLRGRPDGCHVTLLDPSTGEAFLEAPVSGPADVDRPSPRPPRRSEWRDATPSERSLALLRIADAIEARAEELVGSRVGTPASRWL